MKNLNIRIFGFLAFLFILAGCEREGIDPITRVEPGQDEGAPQVNIKYPQQGKVIKEASELSNITIDLAVEDDIEIQEIVVLVDGEVVETFTEFTDYRIALKKVTFEGLSMGEHTVTVRATDMEGKETVQTTTFSKEPPYIAMYENEIFYMAFDKSFMELIELEDATQVGNPGFSDEAKEGTGSYKGAADSYLTIPLAELEDEFTLAFWYKIDPSADRAGILTATDDSDKNQGFRLFRESAGADAQVIKLNVGAGESEIWNDGGTISTVEPEWTHITVTVSPTGTAIYFNGVLVRATTVDNVAIDWTGVENLVIGSGLNFSDWGHNSDPSLIDELRIFDAALTAEEVSLMVNPPSEDISLYLPFDGNYNEQVSGRSINVVGSPQFTQDAKEGSEALKGADGAYLTFPSQNLLSEEFSATFWYKVNPSPDRAGIISISAVNPEGANKNNLTKGFQLFREASGDSQRIKASVGTGNGNSWNDGGLIDPAAGEWVHIGFVITENKSRIYINGELATEAPVTGGVDWTGADLVSVMSGAPRFVEWNHLSDQSAIDDLRFYRVALTEEEIEADMNN